MGAKQIFILRLNNLFTLLLLFFYFSHASAEDKDLFELYLQALQNDPVLSSEKFQNEAVRFSATWRPLQRRSVPPTRCTAASKP